MRDSLTAAIGTPDRRSPATIADETPAGQAMASLTELDRRTAPAVRRYEDARGAFIAAAAALEHHAERFDAWAGKLADAGGRHPFPRPPVPEGVTMEEIGNALPD